MPGWNPPGPTGATGATGPAGPMGPVGATGVTGPAGASIQSVFLARRPACDHYRAHGWGEDWCIHCYQSKEDHLGPELGQIVMPGTCRP